MFCVIYEFEVLPEHTTEFKQLWRSLTQHVKESGNGLGSRLHKESNRPDVYVAYAQWPDKSTWEAFTPLNEVAHAEQTKRLRDICANIAISYQLEVMDDLLEV